ncbi:fas-associated death domain protein-like [Trichoplusia ni]|uniref:Fas-associated death domain protein-like n=1 Tax=Trichoplusia ni TaxID=7111 RepID=A0A7E5WG00_TRINI|nr:fas-associated death domain protein-like [Trichoplusia ni]
MTLSEYSQLKQYIVFSVGTNERHSMILSSLKELFREAINSVRRFEQINTIGQLLKVLEIRDLLSEDNVECLKSIALKLPNPKEVIQKITDYEHSHVPRVYGNYYETSSQNIKREPPIEESFLTSCPVTNTLSKRKKQRIFETIIEEIGSFWRDLGRNLKIRESKIDEIDFQNTTLAVKAKALMDAFESRADPQRWFFVLCDALEKCRRKDLARSIQDIMAMNI